MLNIVNVWVCLNDGWVKFVYVVVCIKKFLFGFYLMCVLGKNLLYLIDVFGRGIVIFNVLVFVLLNLKLLFFKDKKLVEENLVCV